MAFSDIPRNSAMNKATSGKETALTVLTPIQIGRAL
jgi:hypothetical protein